MANATSGMTTIRQNTTRTVHHNIFFKDLARCSIFDFSDQKIVSHESVINDGHNEFIYNQGISLLERVSLTKSENLELLQQKTIILWFPILLNTVTV